VALVVAAAVNVATPGSFTEVEDLRYASMMSGGGTFQQNGPQRV
jgi:hypothetical protein